MDFKITTNASKMWDAMTNNAAHINSYYSNPDMFEIIMKVDETKIMAFKVVYLLLCFLILSSTIRACMDPFSIKLHKKISELEERLEEYDDLYQDLLFEKKDLIEKLDAANALVGTGKTWHRCECKCETGNNFLRVKRRKV